MKEEYISRSKVLTLVNRKKLSAESACAIIQEMEEIEQGETPRAFDGIAITGLSCQFPGAGNSIEFWNNLEEERNFCKAIPQTRWKSTPQMKAALLDTIDEFDPYFFNLSPKEAEFMDPQQRLFLMEAWKAFEDAGYSKKELDGKRCGVFVGCSAGDYGGLLMNSNSFENSFAFTGNTNSILASRISYLLNLKGPAIAIDTACSSSLVAIYLACESINNKDCQLAIAGGVTLYSTSLFHRLTIKCGMLSPDGQCKTFDDSADGFVPGEGVGALVLKPLKQAVSDNDHIYGIIKGYGINQDGKTSGITAPGAPSQAELEYSVYKKFNINPETISYIEAHGTGTKLGDPIEIEALTSCFRRFTGKKQFCAIGSVKTNIGHTIETAGIAGVIKVLLSFRHSTIPASLNYTVPNKNIDFENSPFYVAASLREWKEERKRAAVSAFGFSGTNAHIVLENFTPDKEKTESIPGRYLMAFSARTEKSLQDKLFGFRKWLDYGFDHPVIDIAYTLLLGRSHFKYRKAFIVKDLSQLKKELDMVLNREQQNGRYHFDPVPARQDDGDDELLSEAHTVLDKLKTGSMGGNELSAAFGVLAECFHKGLDPDWNRLFEDEKCHKVSLPAYSFDLEHYWIGTEEKETEPGAPAEQPFQAAGQEYSILEKAWGKSHPVKSLHRKGALLVSAGKQSKRLAETLGRINQDLDILLITHGSHCKRKTRNLYSYNFFDYNQGLEVYSEIETLHLPLLGYIDLTDYGVKAEADYKLPAGKIAFLQKMIASCKSQPLRILQVTSCLQPFQCSNPVLAGAGMLGLYAMLGSEYKQVISKTMDIDSIAREEEISHFIIEEFFHDEEINQVCYRRSKRPLFPFDNERFIPFFRSIFREEKGCVPEPVPNRLIHPDKVYAISGGTGQIGLQLAHILCNLGVKKLILMGKSGLPGQERWPALLNDPACNGSIKDKIKKLSSLAGKGVELFLFSGSLDNEKELASFLDTVDHIDGFFHCAGFVNHTDPAFIKKDIKDMEEVLLPKITGVNNIFKIISKKPFDFFILFSSISSAVPALSRGISDYVMANTYMDCFARFHKSRGLPVYSFNWPPWDGTAMADQAGTLNRSYHFRNLEAKDAFYLMERSLALDNGAVFLPCIVDGHSFHPEFLMSLVPVKRAGRKRNNPVAVHTGSRNTLTMLRKLFSEELKIPGDKLEDDREFEEMGIDSIIVAQLVKKIEDTLSIVINPSILLENTTLKSLSCYIDENRTEKEETVISYDQVFPAKRNGEDAIAVVGIACEFPGAENKDVFWTNLENGVSGISEVPGSRWDISALYSRNYEYGKSISKWGGFIKDIEYFDPAYFKIDEKMAAHIDPLMRKWLEVSVQVLRDGGYDNHSFSGKKLGVFVGSRISKYSDRIPAILPQSVVGWGQNFIATHVSNFLNGKGPSLVVDTACSSSLVAIYLACKSLLNNETEAAIAGGVDMLLDEHIYLTMSAAKVLSPDGRCFTFDERANGFVPGEGCGAVLLKTLSKACRDGDRIYAVIESGAVNNDGSTMGMTTPNPEAQMEVIREALVNKTIDPASISYIETHGTGTMIGDPIELRALFRAFSLSGIKKQSCGVGSVKSNIGHLLSAAGIASFIKVALALYHKKIPPTLNCHRPNPRFNFNDSPFYPVTALIDWQPNGEIRRAGISAFGFGGTNCHIIVREPDKESQTASVKKALPPVQFHKKRYWLNKTGGTVVYSGNKGFPDETKDPLQPAALPDLLKIDFS
ncbi:MAG: KR domain-containing protein [Spirochaetales bacterium]|nr:KR domain-containing protein [Spirochaetales bacterium]